MHDYYAILGVQPDADLATIKKAYRQKAQQCHPDRGGSHEAMVLLNEAWFVLWEAERRAEYDAARGDSSSTAARDWESRTEDARSKARGYGSDWAMFSKWMEAVTAEAGGPGACPKCGYSSGWVGSICRYCDPQKKPTRKSQSGESGAVLLILIICLVVWSDKGCGEKQDPKPKPAGRGVAKPPPPTPIKTLVILIPGTYGNDDHWPTVRPNHATFASELQNGVGHDYCTIYPFVWKSSVEHSTRAEAATMLAYEVNRRASGFDKIVMVGHSHGGNVGLLAAGLINRRVDLVVCLSTPNLYLKANAEGNSIAIPIYCPPSSVRNIGNIITLTPTNDDVANMYAGWRTGLTENTAIHLTREWRELYSNPRLTNDSDAFTEFWEDVFGGERTNNLSLSPFLFLHGVKNVQIQSMYLSGRSAHSSIHSRRMGEIVGNLIVGGLTAGQLEYLRTLVIDNDDDFGEPIDIASYRSLRRSRLSLHEQAGWRLRQVEISLHPSTRSKDADSDGSAPDPRLYIKSPQGDKTYFTSVMKSDSMHALWSPEFCWPVGWEGGIAVVDEDVFGSEYLGGWILRPNRSSPPPTRFESDPDQGVLWSGEAKWEMYHH